MVAELYENLKTGENPRKFLIAIKQELKEEHSRRELLDILQGDYSYLLGLLQHTEPKVRGNAAIVLGRLKQNENTAAIYDAYARETKLFIRSNYLDALAELDITNYRPDLEKRMQELESYSPGQEEEKHIREELASLRKLLKAGQISHRHKFQGYDATYGLILTTGSNYQEITARQIKGGKVTILKNGVRVITSHIKPILQIPTYQEMLFLLNTKKTEMKPKQTAKALAESNLLDMLKKAHNDAGSFYFRLEIHGRMSLEERSDFIKKCAYALEQETGYQLRNSTSDYELAIRLMECKDSMFFPLVKLYTFEEKRFFYRKNTIATSIRPCQAALAVALAKPYMMEHARVLDPFCGVGTMLIERDRICPAKVMYGIDSFGQAIAGARENTHLAGKEINYINRDFFAFHHRELFDEIITNMPDKGKKDKKEQDLMYGKFFGSAGKHLTNGGKIIMYSNEKNYVKKYLRLHGEYHLIQEYSMDGKGIYYLFIIEKRVS